MKKSKSTAQLPPSPLRTTLPGSLQADGSTSSVHRRSGGSGEEEQAWDPMQRNPVWGDQHMFQRRLKQKQKRDKSHSKSLARLPSIPQQSPTSQSPSRHRKDSLKSPTSQSPKRGRNSRNGKTGFGSFWADLDEDVQFVEEQDDGSEDDFSEVGRELDNAFSKLMSTIPQGSKSRIKDESVKEEDVKPKNNGEAGKQRMSLQQLTVDRSSTPGHVSTSYSTV